MSDTRTTLNADGVHIPAKRSVIELSLLEGIPSGNMVRNVPASLSLPSSPVVIKHRRNQFEVINHKAVNIGNHDRDIPENSLIACYVIESNKLSPEELDFAKLFYSCILPARMGVKESITQATNLLVQGSLVCHEFLCEKYGHSKKSRLSQRKIAEILGASNHTTIRNHIKDNTNKSQNTHSDTKPETREVITKHDIEDCTLASSEVQQQQDSTPPDDTGVLLVDPDEVIAFTTEDNAHPPLPNTLGVLAATFTTHELHIVNHYLLSLDVNDSPTSPTYNLTTILETLKDIGKDDKGTSLDRRLIMSLSKCRKRKGKDKQGCMIDLVKHAITFINKVRP